MSRSRDRTFIEHWNGGKWSTVNIVNPPSASAIDLNGISCSAANSCFAAGSYTTPKAKSVLFERWDGGHWTSVPISGPAAARTAYAVTCRSGTFCVAVGGPLVARWNGTKWTSDPTAP